MKLASKTQIDITIDFALTNFRKKHLESEVDMLQQYPFVTRKGYFLAWFYLRLRQDAMRVGLVVNELVTNSVKHAFADVDTPKIIL